MTKRKEYVDPFEKLANTMAEVAEKVVKKSKKKTPHCPKCGEKLWKKRNGNYSCTNDSCNRGTVTPEEIAINRVSKQFLNSFKNGI